MGGDGEEVAEGWGEEGGELVFGEEFCGLVLAIEWW